MAEHKEYPAVDVFKMLCAILVIMIHTKPFENHFWLDAAIGMVTRFAVPFFFTISGFFLFQKVYCNEGKKWTIIGQYLIRLLRFYIIWFVVLRIVDILFGGSTIKSVGYYIKQFFFTTDGSALWFVPALIWAILFVSILLRKIQSKFIFYISVVFLLVGYCFSTMLSITEKWPIVQVLKPMVNFIGVQGAVFFAFPYVAMGAMIAQSILKPEIKKDIIYVILFFVCLGVESIIMVRRFNAPLTFLWVAAMPMTYFTTRLTLTLPIKNKSNYYILRKISSLCYVLHIAIFKIIAYVFQITGFSDQQHLVLTTLTIVITILASYCAFILSNRKPCSWLRHLM